MTVFSLCLFSQLAPLPIDNSLEDNVLHDSNLQEYTDFHKSFGNDRILIAAGPCEELDKKTLTALFKLDAQLMATGKLKKVLSPLSLVTDLSGINKAKDLEDWLKVEGNVEGFRDKLRLVSVANSQVISFENKTIGIVLVLEDAYKYTDISVISDVKAIIENSDLFPEKFTVTGVPDIIRVIYNYTRFSQKFFSPATIVLMAVMLFFLYRTPFGIIAPLVAVIIPLLWLLSLFNIFAKTANFITTMVPPLMLGIAMTSCIHIVTAYFFLSSDEEEFDLKLLVQALRDQFTPIMLCQVTTFLGFFTLAANGIGAVRDYGLFACLGLFLILLSVFVLLPVIITLFKITKQRKTAAMTSENFFRNLSGFVIKRKYWIIIVSTLAAILCFSGLRLMSVETSVLRHLPQDHKVIRDIKYIESNLGGIVPVHLVLERDGEELPDTLVDPELCKKIYILQQKIEKIQYVDTTVSFVNFVQDYDRLFSDEVDHIPPSADEVADYLDFFRPDSAEFDDPKKNPAESPVDRFIARDYKRANIALRIRDVGSRDFNRIFEEIEIYLKEAAFQKMNVKTYITGRAYLWVLTSQIIAWNQLTNFLLALVIICLVIILYFRSLSIGLIALVPNVLPLAVIYGVMGYMDINLNTLTGMIACVAIGMTVDDTIHFIYAFREAKMNGAEAEKAVFKAMLKKGSSMVFTTLVIIAGFSVLMLSQFPPTFQFGACISFTFTMALVLDLLLTPALLLVLDPFSKEKRENELCS